jgi:hypothetical protein
LVGVGSVCRRQDEAEIGRIVSSLAGGDLKLHGFGVKKTGLRRYGRHLGVGGLDGVEFCGPSGLAAAGLHASILRELCAVRVALAG